MMMERRSLAGQRAAVQLRADGTAKRIEGYAAVFYRASDPGTEFWLWDDMVERIQPGAFDRAIREDDVRGLFNHDPSRVLGRNTAGTMQLTVDATGLRYSIEPGDTSTAADVLAHLQRGDVSGSSFSFAPRTITWTQTQVDGRDIWVRDVVEVELYDVGPVTFPAYSATSSGARGRSMIGRPMLHADASDLQQMRSERDAFRLCGSAAIEARLRQIRSDRIEADRLLR